MKTMTKAEADAIDPAALRSMGVHIRSTDDGVIIYETADEIPPPPVTPPGLPPLSAWEFRKLLTALGIREAAEAFVAQADQDMKDAYEYASSFERSHPLLEAVIAALKLDPAVVDAKWAQAAGVAA